MKIKKIVGSICLKIRVGRKMNFITFKSDPKYYVPEKLNFKRNTVRFTDDWDATRWLNYRMAYYVLIENSKTGRTFARSIKHKCRYKNLVVISW